MAARGGFRAEEDIVGLTGKTPEPALALRQRDVQSGEAMDSLEAFATALRTRPAEPGPVLRPVWISPKEV